MPMGTNELILSDWKQDGRQLKLIFIVEELEDLPASAIKLKVAKSSVSLTVSLPPKNKDSPSSKIFTVEKLYKKIVPAETSSVRKGQKLSIFLVKRDEVDWPTLARNKSENRMAESMKKDQERLGYKSKGFCVRSVYF